MEYRVLGPLEVLDGTRRVDVPPGKPRTVLVLLLLNGGRVVSADRLIDELWSERPPVTAAKALQVYVSGLRKALGADAIVTQAPGYVLELEPDQLDLARFDRLRAAGSAALVAGEPERAAELLAEALALWRGPALADVLYEPFAQAEAARAEELRAAALEDRIDALLALRRHAEVVGELVPLVRANPTRERLRRQQMLALYRSGRQAEALETYQRARTALIDELGIEPGPALRELERAILAQDPALEAPEERPREPAGAAPPAGSAVRASPPPATAREERKVATVVFADLVGSTAMADDEDPERVRATLTRFYEAMACEVAGTGGTVEKFAGDAILALFGAPIAQEDHAERALHAALGMRRRLDELFGGRLALHVGIGTGEVVVGGARAGGSFVAGDVVNVAARLEQAAAPGEILVLERTAIDAGGAFDFGEPITVEAKGKPGGVRCRRLGRSLSRARPRGVRGLGKAFVGRDAELDRLQDAYGEVAQTGAPLLVTILGDAGTGKTRLAEEAWRWLGEQSPAPALHSGRCLPYGRGTTYWPFGEILKAHYAIRESDASEALLSRLGGRAILGLSAGLDVAHDLHARAARDRLHQAWAEFLEESAPAVVLLEDLHWAEDELLDLVELLLRAMRAPVLIVATARPELLAGRPGWGGARRNASTLPLAPLSAHETHRMLSSLLGGEPPEALTRIADRAEGNPFFVEELLASLIDRGLLTRTNGGWTVGEIPDVVPDSVQSVIAARVDLLGEDDKAALQAASIIGRVFWSGPVYELIGDADPDLLGLEDRELIRRRPASAIAGEVELEFKHQLIREVAYSMLTKSERARGHARFAAWLERLGDGRDDHASLLAHHYAEAVRPEDADLVWADDPAEHERLRRAAVAWLRRAGELAFARYEMGEAAAMLEGAAKLEPTPALWASAADAHRRAFLMSEFRAGSERAIELAGDDRLAAPYLARLAQEGSESYQWRHPPDPADVEGWLQRALGAADPGSEARARALIARATMAPATAADASAEAIAIAEGLGDAHLRSGAYDAQAHVLTAEGDLAGAAEMADAAVALIPRVDDPARVGGIMFQALFVYLRAGRLAGTWPLAERNSAQCVRLSPHDHVHGMAGLTLVATLTGRWPDVPVIADRAATAAAANGETPCQFNWRSQLMCASAYATAGHAQAALEAERRALDCVPGGWPLAREPAVLRLALALGEGERVRRLLAEDPGADRWDVDYAAARLDALAAVGDTDAVEAEAERALRLGGYVEPFAMRALGRIRADDDLGRRAAERFVALGLAWRAAEPPVTV